MNFLSPRVGKQKLNGNRIGMLHRNVLRNAEAVFTGVSSNRIGSGNQSPAMSPARSTGPYKQSGNQSPARSPARSTGPYKQSLRKKQAPNNLRNNVLGENSSDGRDNSFDDGLAPGLKDFLGGRKKLVKRKPAQKSKKSKKSKRKTKRSTRK